ncbi:MAG: FG-GAP-like repeat-containing protein [Myxococcota bacterium]
MVPAACRLPQAVALGLLVVLACSPSERPPGLRFDRHEIEGTGQPFAVVAADLDRDGKVDLVVSDPSLALVSVYRGHGDGSFSGPVRLKTGRRPRGLAVADLDADGWPDLAVAATAADAVMIHRGRGEGHFAAGRAVPVGTRPFMLVPSDLDADGALDLVVACEGETAEGQALWILRGDGHGDFEARGVRTGKYGSDVAVADYDADGRLDVAISTWGTNDVHIHFGAAGGGFRERRSFSYAGHGIYRVFSADLNRDGRPDMIWNDLMRSGLYVLYGDGRGRFARTRLLPADLGVRHALAPDLNHDGWPDPVSVNTRAGSLVLLLSDGHGDYHAPQRISIGELARMVAPADFDGDGRLDLAVTSMRSNRLVILLNRGAGPLAAAAPKTERPEPIRGPGKPHGVALSPSGDVLFVADREHHRVLRIAVADGDVDGLVGDGWPGHDGVGGPARQARLRYPSDVALGPSGDLYVADSGNHRVLRVDAAGTLHAFAGRPEPGFSGDGGPALDAQLNRPLALAVDPAGAVFIADAGNLRIRRVDPSGVIQSVAGNGRVGASGDGGPARNATLGPVSGLALAPDGALLMADPVNGRVRRLDPDGRIRSLASAADGGALRGPIAVASDASGTLYVLDGSASLILSGRAGERLTVLAGPPRERKASARAAGGLLEGPYDLALASDGTLYFTEPRAGRVRLRTPSGELRTLAGPPGELESEVQDAAHTGPHRRIAPSLAELERARPRLELSWALQRLSGSDANAVYALAPDGEGGVYAAGDVGSGADWRVVHLDAQGQELWRYEHASAAVEIPFALARTPQGALVVAGTVFAAAQTHGLVIALSSAGEELWRHVGDPGEREILRAVAVDREGLVLLAGEANGRWRVRALDARGQPLWTWAGGSGSVWALDVGAQGRLLMGGMRGRSWSVRALGPGRDVLWERRGAEGGVALGTAARALRALPDGGAVVTGYVGERVSQLQVERLDAKGGVLWQYIDPEAGSLGRALSVDTRGHVRVAGDVGGDWLLLELSPAGEPTWRLRYDGGGRPENSDLAHAILALGPREFVVAGAVHTRPPAPPSLGRVSWRIARYRILAAAD